MTLSSLYGLIYIVCKFDSILMLIVCFLNRYFLMIFVRDSIIHLCIFCSQVSIDMFRFSIFS